MDPGIDYPGMPRWVKVAIALIIALVLLAVILKVTGGANGHGPGRHMSARAGR